MNGRMAMLQQEKYGAAVSVPAACWRTFFDVPGREVPRASWWLCSANPICFRLLAH